VPGRCFCGPRARRPPGRNAGRRLAIRLTAITDAEDAHRVFLKGEEDAVIAQTEAERAGHVAVQGFDVAAAGTSVMQDSVEKTQGGRAVQTADIGLGVV